MRVAAKEWTENRASAVKLVRSVRSELPVGTVSRVIQDQRESPEKSQSMELTGRVENPEKLEKKARKELADQLANLAIAENVEFRASEDDAELRECQAATDRKEKPDTWTLT